MKRVKTEDTLVDAAMQMPYSELLAKKESIRERLNDFGSIMPDAVHEIPIRVEVHWDFTMKEMVLVRLILIT
jgi:hypothetical protein